MFVRLTYYTKGESGDPGDMLFDAEEVVSIVESVINGDLVLSVTLRNGLAFMVWDRERTVSQQIILAARETIHGETF